MKKILVFLLFSELILVGCRKDVVTVGNLQNFLAGSWKVSVTPTYNGYWEADLTVDSIGYYTAHVTSGSTDEFLDNGVDDFAFPERKIVLRQIDNLGYASGDINFMHYGGTMMTYGIVDLMFSEDRNTVEFWVGFNDHPKLIRYLMVRQ